MQLVIDSNVIMSALISKGLTRSLIFNNEFTLFAPDHTLVEIEEHKSELLSKSKMDSRRFDLLLELIISEIFIVKKEEYEKYLEEANDMITDKDDSPFLALAIKLDCALWTNDSKLKKEQKRIKIYHTEELLKFIT